MEFMNRGNRPTQQASPSPSVSPASSNGSKRKDGSLNWLKMAAVTLLFSGTVLVVALLWFVVLGSPSSEGKHVDEDRMQAVFLNGGQVYFGKIEDLNDKYMRVRDIYYLRVNQQVQPNQENSQAAANDISLVKLGCELHGPQDEMLINREQVVFWENLKGDGQVAEAVAKYKQDNPNGQDCEANQSQSTQQSTTPAEDQ